MRAVCKGNKDGSFDVLYGETVLLKNCYPGVDSEPIRAISVTSLGEGCGVAWQTADGTITMRVRYEADGVLALHYELVDYTRPVHTFWPIQRAAAENVAGVYRAAWGMGGDVGYVPYAKLWEQGGFSSAGIGCIKYTSVEKAMSVFALDQSHFETVAMYEARQLMGMVPLSYRADGMHMGKEEGLGFGIGLKLEHTNGPTLALPTICVVVRDSVAAAMEDAASRIGAAMGARLSAPPAYHWCSWYYSYHNFDMAQLEENLAGLASLEKKPPIRYMQIDAGYFPSTGDWLIANERWPKGLQGAFAAIEAAGYIPGIWIGPFMVGNRSELYRQHPDWVLQDLKDEPVCCWITDNEPKPWGYQDEEYYVLDTSHPDAMAYMKEVFSTFRAWGAKLFKTDFTVWGMQDSTKVKRHTPGKTDMEYFREFMEEIRTCIGEESYWLGCIAPFIPFVGFADGMRIGNDVGSCWDGAFGPKNMMMSLIGNHYMNHNFYQTDPDAVMLRDFQIRLTDREVESLALLAAVSGGCIYTSDPVHKMGQDRQDLFRYIAPDVRRKPVIPFLEKAKEETVLVYEKNEKGKGLLFVFNPLDRDLCGTYQMQDLGFADTDYVMDLRSEKAGLFAPVADGVVYVSVPARGCRLFLVSEGIVSEISRENLWENLR